MSRKDVFYIISLDSDSIDRVRARAIAPLIRPANHIIFISIIVKGQRFLNNFSMTGKLNEAINRATTIEHNIKKAKK